LKILTSIWIILRYIFRLEGSVPREGEKSKAHRILGREYEGTRPLGKSSSRGDENDGINVNEIR
jgi:hypothetical protein